MTGIPRIINISKLMKPQKDEKTQKMKSAYSKIKGFYQIKN